MALAARDVAVPPAASVEPWQYDVQLLPLNVEPAAMPVNVSSAGSGVSM